MSAATTAANYGVKNMTPKWKDVTTYSRSDKERTLATWRIRFGRLLGIGIV